MHKPFARTAWQLVFASGVKMQRDKSHRGSTSQFFVAGELCRRGYAALITVGNTPNTDILCSNTEGTKFVHIQVQTFVPGTKTCSVGMKAETNPGKRFFWVLAGIPEPHSALPFEYFIVPAADMAMNVATFHPHWLSAPGKRGQRHKDSSVRAAAVARGAPAYFWCVEAYRDQWQPLERELDA